jgi:hypothetical protein
LLSFLLFYFYFINILLIAGDERQEQAATHQYSRRFLASHNAEKAAGGQIHQGRTLVGIHLTLQRPSCADFFCEKFTICKRILYQVNS